MNIPSLNREDWPYFGYLAALLAYVGARLWTRLKAPKQAWRPFTAQFGDETFSGVYFVRGDQVLVRCRQGAKSGPMLWGKPEPTAERLLIEICRATGAID